MKASDNPQTGACRTVCVPHGMDSGAGLMTGRLCSINQYLHPVGLRAVHSFMRFTHS